VVFALAKAGDDPEDAITDQREYGDIGRAGIRLQAALCALELLLPGETPEP
jgi:nicotinamide-nucleotide amidase